MSLNIKDRNLRFLPTLAVTCIVPARARSGLLEAMISRTLVANCAETASFMRENLQSASRLENQCAWPRDPRRKFWLAKELGHAKLGQSRLFLVTLREARWATAWILTGWNKLVTKTCWSFCIEIKGCQLQLLRLIDSAASADSAEHAFDHETDFFVSEIVE